MNASYLISRTPRRPYVIAPSVKQKEELLKSIAAIVRCITSQWGRRTILPRQL